VKADRSGPAVVIGRLLLLSAQLALCLRFPHGQRSQSANGSPEDPRKTLGRTVSALA